MALQDMPLSDLQSAVSLNGTDLFYVVQSGESKKVTLAVMIGNKADLENGLVPLRELPNSVVMVANDTERFALDSDDVNNGFIVLQYDATHPEISAKMFLVINNTNLDSEAGYQPFAADAIWGNIINRPTNLAYLAGDDEELPSVSPVLRESSLQNNLVTTLPNYPLDARQGKVLNDKITAVNQNLAEKASKSWTRISSGSSGGNKTVTSLSTFSEILIVPVYDTTTNGCLSSAIYPIDLLTVSQVPLWSRDVVWLNNTNTVRGVKVQYVDDTTIAVTLNGVGSYGIYAR